MGLCGARGQKQQPQSRRWHRCHPSRHISSQSAAALWVKGYKVTFFECLSPLSVICVLVRVSACVLHPALSCLSLVPLWEGLAGWSAGSVSRGQQWRCQTHSLSPTLQQNVPPVTVSKPSPYLFHPHACSWLRPCPGECCPNAAHSGRVSIIYRGHREILSFHTFFFVVNTKQTFPLSDWILTLMFLTCGPKLNVCSCPISVCFSECI